MTTTQHTAWVRQLWNALLLPSSSLSSSVMTSMNARTRVIPILSSSKIQVLKTPKEFHTQLSNSILEAKQRLCLASLYLGAGSGDGEEEIQFLEALRSRCTSSNTKITTQILMDANRATRPITYGTPSSKLMTSSAKAVYDAVQNDIYLYQTLRSPYSYLPTPLNEVMGVFHVKAYIMDDTLFLSGANLSQEYFKDRQDRYVMFQNASELADFYVDLVEVLCQHGQAYPSKDTPDKSHLSNQQQHNSSIIHSLTRLFSPRQMDEIDWDDPSVIAYAIPTFAHPNLNLPFPSDQQQMEALLNATSKAGLTVRMASAYLNPTPSFLSSLLQQNADCTVLTAGPLSHGFAPKPGKKRTGDFVPHYFRHINEQLMSKYPLRMRFYQRPNWTFHAKGIWVFSPDQKRLVAAVIGSGNYGYRSERRDVESNVILLFPQETSPLQEQLMSEWERLCQYATEEIYNDDDDDDVRQKTIWESSQKPHVKLLCPLIRPFL
jgi:CDP-diacylglycerol---glycerol-3-phosphate 3-phosphatidyltransferase